MTTLHPNVPLLVALQWAQKRGEVLVTDGRRIAATPKKDIQPGWKRLRVNARRIKG